MVQQRDTRKLIQRRTIDRLAYILSNKPGWDAPVYSDDPDEPHWY